MKTKLLIFAFALVFMACNNDDAASNSPHDNPRQDEILLGKWNLGHIGGGFAGVDNNFSDGEIIWSFNDSDSTLLVTETTGDTTHIDGLHSGTYAYYKGMSQNLKTIFIDNYPFGSYEIENDSLVIDQNFEAGNSDGFKFELTPHQ